MVDLLIAATRKGLFRFDATAADPRRWSIAGRDFLGEPVTACVVDPTGRRWLAALRLGHFGVKLHASDDAAASWHEIDAPAYPAKPEDSDDPVPWTLDQVWVLEGMHRSRPARLWAGTLPGGLFKSEDYGASWALVESLWNRAERRRWFGGGYDHPGVHSIAASSTDPDDVLIGVSCGGAWRSRDGGASWRLGTGMVADYMPPDQRGDDATQDPHAIVRSPSHPDVAWTQHHNGVWRSDDGGDHWHRLTRGDGDFGFAVAVHPGDPQTAWFVPATADAIRFAPDAAMVVSRTRDGGRSFEALRNGLPQSDAYHLVYRHALAVSDDGEVLAIASTTGSLWASVDQGDSWTCVSTSLPPVYALRFT